MQIKKYGWQLAIAGCLVIPALPVLAQNNTSQVVTDTTVARLRMAVESHPGDIEAHEAYIKEVGVEDSLLVKQYEQWMKLFPGEATIAFALGNAYANAELPAAKDWLLKAVKIDPKLGEAWLSLAFDAQRWGNFDQSLEYLRKASEANPQNPDYAFYYASDLQKKDRAKGRALSYEVARRFPDSERGAQALYWLAYRTTDSTEQKKAFEQLYHDFSPAKFNWSSAGMVGYYDFLLAHNPTKAVALAQQMAGYKEGQGWEQKVAMAKTVIHAHELVQQGKAVQAEELINPVVVPRYGASILFMKLEKARIAHAAGHTAAAYDSLLVSYVKEPEPAIHTDLLKYAAALKKSPATVQQEVWDQRMATAQPATPFSLEQYLQTGKLSLADLKGKVVLLTYWFPGCGPCRGEFPHFENVIRKFSKQDVVYIGINIVPNQDEYVVPFMKGSGYSFIPLRDIADRDHGNLAFRGAPTNFLIDQQGNIVFHHFRTDEKNEDVLEEMIRSTLQHGEGKGE